MQKQLTLTVLSIHSQTENAGSSKYWADSFGDWCPPFTDGTYNHSFSEGEIVNTSLYYKITDLLSGIAGILGKEADSTYYSNVAKSIRSSFNSRLFNYSANLYGSGKQITYILPLLYSMVPSEREASVFDNLVNNVTQQYSEHFGAGIYGTSFLPDLLCDFGRADIAYSILRQTTYPSFGHQIINYGATTTWEQWGMYKTGAEMETFDHAMFSGADKTFFTKFGGIEPMSPGYKTICIKPCLPEGLRYVRSSVKTIFGTIASDWEKKGSTYSHSINIPVNTTALIYIPGSDPAKVFENGMPVLKSKSVRYLRAESNYLVYEVGSGMYFFSYGIPGNKNP